jgi:hypothetical protein
MRANSDKDSGHSDRSSKEAVVNEDGRKLGEFCERNSLEILKGKYGEDVEVELTFINQLERSVIDCALVSQYWRNV